LYLMALVWRPANADAGLVFGVIVFAESCRLDGDSAKIR
jgi:hypothetical protein